MAQACNPSYLEGRDVQKRFKVSQGRWGLKTVEIPPQPMAGHDGAHLCCSQLCREAKQEDHSPGQPRHKERPYLKNNQHTKGDRDAQVVVRLARQVRGPEFNPQYHQKQTKNP
jgi:hypothetical protein